MPSKNIILSSVAESFASIWRNKLLFALLFVLQIIFFAIFSYVNYHYQIKIAESSNAIIEYLGKQQLDEASISENILQQKSILGDDPLLISRKFNDIKKNFRAYAFYAFVLLAVFSSLFWALTHKFFNKTGIKQFKHVFFRNFIALLFYLGLIFLFFLSLLGISIIQLTTEASKYFSKYIVFLIISIILGYFMFISLSLTNKTELKDIVQRTLVVGIKKAHYILAVYLIDVILFGVSAFLLYYFIEKNPVILFISIILLVFSFVFGRMLMVSVVEKLKN